VPARFFAPLATTTGDTIALPDDEAIHLIRVLRLGPGDEVVVFDGRGRSWDAEVTEVGRQSASVRLGVTTDAAPEPRRAIALAIAVLKADKMDDVMRDAVMLGVTAITPLVTARTEIALAAIEKSRRVERWQRIAVSSAKQCGRAVVPAIHPAVTFEAYVAERRAAVRIMLVEPGARHEATSTLREIPSEPAIELIVGPEGGWTAQELDVAARSSCMLVTLGGITLRADAAPLVALSALRAIGNDL
jgi:16S rRNA (uracil1498-N3)-methyltransferase